MVKFSKQLEIQLVPEWRGAYCQYKLLKKILNKIKESPCSIPDYPEIYTSSGSSLKFIQNRSKNFWSHIDLIQVHNKKSETGDDQIFETELLGPIAHSLNDQLFFASLDSQLNKVNKFYKQKEEEFMQRVALLDKQICALTGVKKLLEQDRIRSCAVLDDGNASERRSELGKSLASVESGFYGQSGELLESLAKVTLAATCVPSLPLRRRSGEIIEASSGGSLESLASNDVCTRNLNKSAINLTGSNQVRLIIPRTTPAATIAAMIQMLWEDVFCQSKQSSTDLIGTEDNSLSQKKVQIATLMLRAAFIEFYRGLGMLKSFSSLNLVAFAKIMKKYDKVTGLCVAERYMHHVELAYVNTSDNVTRLMENVEYVFTEHFTGGNRRKAMTALRPMHRTASHYVTYFLGFFTGCSMALIAALCVIVRVDGDYNDNERLTYLHTIFPSFSVLALVVLHMYLYSWNIFIWRRVRINYAFIFEFSPGSELRYREILLVCTALTALLIGAMVIHLTIHSTLVQGQASAYIDLIPFAVMLIFLVLLFNPLDVCYRSSRFFFLSALLHIVCAPLYKVVLADFFLADQLTSQVSYLTTLNAPPLRPLLPCGHHRIFCHSCSKLFRIDMLL